MGQQPDEVREADGHRVGELHGVTLKHVVEYLVARVGWEELAARVPVKCFAENPSVSSSLTFLRRTPWARQKVESIYVEERTAELEDAAR